MNDQYFPNAKTFKPERWLAADTNELENRMLSFSKGSRGCMGIKYEFQTLMYESEAHIEHSLAYAELFTTFAYVFREFDLELYDTTTHDMDWHDAFTPATFGHLKVKVKNVAR